MWTVSFLDNFPFLLLQNIIKHTKLQLLPILYPSLFLQKHHIKDFLTLKSYNKLTVIFISINRLTSSKRQCIQCRNRMKTNLICRMIILDKFPECHSCYFSIHKILYIIKYRIINHRSFNNITSMRFSSPASYNKIKPFLLLSLLLICTYNCKSFL